MSKGIIVLSQSEDQASDCCIINDKSRKTQSKTYYFPKWQQNIKNKQIQVQSQQPCFIRFKYCTNLNSEQSYVSASQVAPWLTQSTSSIDSPLLRFHNQIIDFFQYIKPSQQTKQKRTTAFNEIKKIILQLFPKVQVYPFGSFVTGLYLPDADIDVAVLTKKNYMADKLYDKLYLVLKKNPFLFTSLQYIKQARVPIIKFVYAKANIHFDICIDNQNGFKQLQYINKLNQAYPQFKYLYLVFKCFLKLRNLSNTYRGGIGGFLLFCLIHIYLQQQNRQSQCHCTLGEHILNFMNFFGENDWSWKVVYVKNAIIQVRAKQPGTFSCISPQDECRDIGKVSFKCIEIFKIFANRYKVLMQKSFEQGQSVLATILNPSHKQFPYGKQKTK